MQINNAGAIMSQRDVNAEGLEKSFATNVLGESNVCESDGFGDSFKKSCTSCGSPGVYILTKSLIPLLEKSADPRVVSDATASQRIYNYY